MLEHHFLRLLGHLGSVLAHTVELAIDQFAVGIAVTEIVAAVTVVIGRLFESINGRILRVHGWNADKGVLGHSEFI